MLPRFYNDRRRAQSGTTLVELLVSVTIMGIALALLVGTISTGLLNATLAKRNTAAEAVVQYEMDEIAASAFSNSPPSYSECFSTENPNAPSAAPSFQATCPDPSSTLRADVTASPGPSLGSQIWSITIFSEPTNVQIGTSVQMIKVKR